MTIMFCAFEGKPLILRLYGHARIAHPHDEQWSRWAADFPSLPGARQIFELDVDLAQTSCGFGVPFFDFKEQREQLNQWTENKGQEKIQEYWLEKNAISIDGKATDMSDII